MSKKELKAFYEGFEKSGLGESTFNKVDDLTPREIYKVITYSCLKSEFGFQILLDLKNVKNGDIIREVNLPQRITNYIKDEKHADYAFTEYKYMEFVERIKARRDTILPTDISE